MTSGDLGLAEGLGQEINEEELDLAELFLYNSPEEDFPVGCDKGEYLWIQVILPLETVDSISLY